MTRKDDQSPAESKSRRGSRTGTDAGPPRDRKGGAEGNVPDPESSQAPEFEPEPGTTLDEATNTVTSTGTSS